MNSENQKQICHFLLDNGIENIIGVPDSTLKHFIAESLKLKKNIIINQLKQVYQKKKEQITKNFSKNTKNIKIYTILEIIKI